jgi:NAD(P)-dependent dehydrogenase (short-subunit alcohol dehydrogenase family)
VINGVGTFAPADEGACAVGRGHGRPHHQHREHGELHRAGAPGIYNTAKFAVRGLSYSLRHSMYQYGIGVSVVHPGLVKSYIYASDDVRPETSRAR